MLSAGCLAGDALSEAASAGGGSARASAGTPSNALTEAERQQVLMVLRSPEYCDLAPAQVWARLLDDGIYLCSISTMYRLLAVTGENRERRRQRTHPAKKKPELIATVPNQVWSWDIERHEALLNRAVVKGRRHRLFAAGPVGRT